MVIQQRVWEFARLGFLFLFLTLSARLDMVLCLLLDAVLNYTDKCIVLR